MNEDIKLQHANARIHDLYHLLDHALSIILRENLDQHKDYSKFVNEAFHRMGELGD